MVERQSSLDNGRGPHFYRKPGGGYVRPIFKTDRLQKLADTIPDVGDGSCKWYGLALVLLEYVFGFSWVERHILDEPKNGFLSRSLGTDHGCALVMHRIRYLAELILNLLPIRGVEACLDQIASGQIESGYAELEAGKLLVTKGIDFRFIWPSGVKGESFDLEILSPNGIAVYADTKCKIETERFSKSGFLNTLEGARKRNLPKGIPGMVIVKVPQQWYETPATMAGILAVCERFLRGTKRIVCVQIFSSMMEFRGDLTSDWLESLVIGNKHHDFDSSLDCWSLTNGPKPPPQFDSWIRLASFYEA